MRRPLLRQAHHAVDGAWQLTYAATTKAELCDAYAAWAPSYDRDSTERWGYAAPQACADALARHVPDRAARVLDAGAGTGLVGAHLARRHGFSRLCAVDLSRAMLRECEKKAGCYTELVEADLETLGAAFAAAEGPPPWFDAAACAGTFTPNHVGARALDEVVRAVRVGGVLAATVREDFGRGESSGDELGRGFREREAALRHEGVLELLEATPLAPYTPRAPGGASEAQFECFVYRVAGSRRED